MKRTGLIGFLIGLFFIVSGSTASAVPITIDPGNYEGSYWVYGTGGASKITGVNVLDLAIGGHSMDIGNLGSQTRKTIIVNTDGTVSNSPTNDSSDSLIFNGTSTVTFKNAIINFDPDQYAGTIWMNYITSSNFEIPNSVVLVPGNNYRVAIGGHDNGGRIFYVDANGQVGPSASDAKSADAFIFNGDTIKFRNVTVRIDAQDYLGHYILPLKVYDRLTGVNDYVLLPGFGYRVKLASLDAAATIWFEVNGDGTVGLYDSSNLYFSSHNEVHFDNSSSPVAIRFKTVTVNFDTGKYEGAYRLDLSQEVVGQYSYGPQSVALVPDNDYAMQFGPSLEPWIIYHVDADGNVGETVNASYPDRTNVFSYSENTISFKTVTLDITPSDELGQWGLYSVTGPVHGVVTGPQIATIISGVKHRLKDYSGSPGQVELLKVSPCEDEPETVTAHMNFLITCLNDDITPPTITAPDDVSVEAAGLLTAVAIGNAWAMDDVGPIMIASDAPAGGFPVGNTTVTWTTTDDAGNSASATQMVTVVDTIAPVITAPADATLEATGLLTPVTLADPIATDMVGVVSLTNDAPTAGLPVNSTTTVTWTATDGAGNSSSAMHSVTVSDTTAPVMTAPANVTEDATGPLTQVNLVDPTATDAVGIATLTNDAPSAGFPVDSTTTVTWTATDSAGNSSTVTQTVTIKPFLLTLNIHKAKVNLHPIKPNHDKIHIKGRYAGFASGDGLNIKEATVMVNGVSLSKVKFKKNGKFEVEGKHLNLSGIDFSVPVTVSVRIGNDLGEQSVLFDSKGKFHDDDKDKDDDKRKR